MTTKEKREHVIEIAPYSLRRAVEETISAPEGLETGYPSLDQYITIPQGAVTIIAGRPSHGKTTFLLNLFLRMVQNKDNKDKAFFFFSYEESQRRLFYRVLNVLSGEEIDKSKNMEQLEYYIRRGYEDNKKINQGKKKYNELTKSQRLWLIYEHHYINDLVSAITYLSERHNIGAVFIDYIQKIKTKGGYGTRQLELQKVSESILETSVDLSIPILLGAQFGRPAKATPYTIKNVVRIDNIREAGDIEQDANLMLGIWNEYKAKWDRYEDAEEATTTGDRRLFGKPEKSDIADIKVMVIKNRDGDPGAEATLKFKGSTLTIKDPTEQE